MFRRLKFIYDKQSTGGLRNFNERKKNVVKKRLKTFMNVYIFRYRIAKAMLHILEQDIVADLSGMRERSVIRNLCGYIGEKVGKRTNCTSSKIKHYLSCRRRLRHIAWSKPRQTH